MQTLLLCVLICIIAPALGKTLSDWYSQGIIPAVSYYYDIEAWAARTTNCVGTDSMACMACSMPMADVLTAAGVAPIGVSNDWWFSPARSATCGTCMKVYMYDTPALGQRAGTNPMKSTVTGPWAYSANVSYDSNVGAYYFIAVVVEWFDRYQSSGLDIRYPIFQQRDGIGQFGVWNVGLEPVPCPVGDTGLSLNFLDYSKPYPVRSDSGWDADDSTGILPSGVEESLCVNTYDGPCGTIVHQPDKNPVGWPKLKVWGSRYPVGDVTLVFNGQEYTMKRSVNDFWEPEPNNPVSDTVTVRIQCLARQDQLMVHGPNGHSHGQLRPRSLLANVYACTKILTANLVSRIYNVKCNYYSVHTVLRFEMAEMTSNVPDNAPESCPGTDSEQAGKASACAGCPNQKICSTAPKGPDPDLQAIAERLESVKNIVLVLSGKGGVGKSTVSAQLALSLASKGLEVGLLDIDICGPSMPRMLGLEGQEIHHSNSGWSPVYVEENLGVMSIGFMLSNPDDAVIWRGPRKNGLIKQFLKDVDWGKLDYLVIDAPPGTSDEHISVVQFLLPSHKAHGNLAGAVIVSTPQEVSLIDVRKEINFCKKTGVPVLGVVENMSGFTVPVASLSFVDKDGHDVSSQIREVLGSINAGNIRANGELLFAKDGAAEKMSAEFGVPFLGKIPMDLEMSKAAEQGVSIFDTAKSSPSALSLSRIVDKIVASKSIP